jgi:hypothetical protein
MISIAQTLSLNFSLVKLYFYFFPCRKTGLTARTPDKTSVYPMATDSDRAQVLQLVTALQVRLVDSSGDAWVIKITSNAWTIEITGDA